MKKYLIFNLQLFAEPNVQTTGLTAEGNNLSAEMKMYYSKYLLKLMQANLVHAQFGKKDSIPKNGGREIEYRMYSSFSAVTEALEEGVTPNGVPLNVTTVTQRLQQYGSYTTISDVLELTAIDNNIKEATEKHSDCAALTINRVTRNELHKTPFVQYAAKDGVRANSRSELTAEHKLTYNDVARMATMLKRNNAPTFDGFYIAIVHPDVAQDIMLDERWIDVQKYKNPESVYRGEIGTLHKVRFVESTEALCELKGKDGCGVYSTLFLGRDAFHVIDLDGAGVEIIVKPAGSSGTADPLNQRSTVGWKIPLYAAKVTIEQYIWSFESGSSLSGMAIPNNT